MIISEERRVSIGSVQFITNTVDQCWATDKELEQVSQAIATKFEHEMKGSPILTEYVRVEGWTARRGCITTTVCVAVVVGSGLASIAMLRKYLPRIVAELSAVGARVKHLTFESNKRIGSTCYLNIDVSIPEIDAYLDKLGRSYEEIKELKEHSSREAASRNVESEERESS